MKWSQFVVMLITSNRLTENLSEAVAPPVILGHIQAQTYKTESSHD